MSYDLSLATTAAFEQSQAGFIIRFIENLQSRRAVRKLLTLDDHLLHDAGTSRADVAWAAQLPLSVNAGWALEERTRKLGRR
jgi:uncharacterized protein YjiS (DUF1127 family)